MERNLSDIDKLIEMLYKKECPSEKEIRQLCYRARDIFIEESNVERITTPVTVCGDIHGQFYDLLELFKEGGRCPDTNYIFLGDYVDRGYYSLETFLLLLSIKIKYPNKITLLRGNHESRQITQVYGFYDECNTKFGSSQVWRYCTETFDYLPVSALINNNIFCVHGGLSPAIISIDQIRLIDRKVEVPHEGALCDLMWSDPQDNLNQWKVSPRGAGFIFGENEVKEFNHRNNITTVCRAHQLVMEGYKYVYDNQLVTVWSAPNYCYRCGNVAAIMQIAEDSSATFKIFREAPEDRRQVPERTNLPNYFL